ncbi:MAG: hypothetical protein K0R92_82 [Lachnospiraceae bacterium]|jgi:uncharacterized protein YjdB|nr:hypothetical protein [Lachnospiraceae bacterium]
MKKKFRNLLIGILCIIATLGIAYGNQLHADASAVSTDGYYFVYNGTNIADGAEVTYIDSANLQLKYGTSGSVPANVTWDSTNDNIVALGTPDVNQNVELNPESPGFATINAYVKDGSGDTIASVSCNVKVPLNIDETATGMLPISASDKILLLDNLDSAADSKNVSLQYTASTPLVTWDSSNETVATVDSNGLVQAVSAGSATIIVTTNTLSKIDNQPLTQTINVVVKPTVVNDSGTSIGNTQKYTLTNTSSLTIKTNANPATNLTWNVTDLNGNVITQADQSRLTYSISTFSGNFELSNMKAGTYKIKAFANSSYSDTTPVQYIDVTVVVPIKVPTTSLIMNVNDSYSLLENTNIPTAGVFNYSSDNNLATTVEAGVIKALKEGVSNIEFTYNTSNGLFAPEDEPTDLFPMKVTVIDGIALSYSTATIYTSGKLQLTALSTDLSKNITWASDNPSAATVDAFGMVTGVAQGKAIITATQTIGGVKKTASATIFVQPSVSSITINPSSATMKVDDNLVLTATVQPSNLSNVTLHWVTSDETVVSITNVGALNATIKAENPGTAVITAINQDNVIVGYSYITVKQDVTGITLSESSITVPLSLKNIQLRANIEPEDATNKNVRWTSTNEQVARVDQTGYVTIVAPGVASIIAVSLDDPTISSLCNITVEIPVASISLDEKTKLMYVGESARLGYLITPETATKKDVIWSSTDTSVVSVDAKGLVTAKGAGQALIIVKTADGTMMATSTITVRQKATGVTFDVDKLEIGVGQSYTIKTTITPANSELTLTWESTNTSVATVDNTGKITGVATGKAVVFAKTSYGGFIYCNVTVVQQPTGIQLNYDEKTIVLGESFQIKATVVPSNAAGVELVWSSSNTKVAKVSTDGTVTSVAGGTAIIKCATKDGKITEFTIVHVVEPVTSLKLNKTTLRIGRGVSYTLKVTIESNSATNPKVKWTSSNTKIATVNANGKVIAKAYGYATITATAQDGSGAEAVCEVRVVRPVTSVAINKSSVTTVVGRSFTLKATVKPTNSTYRSVNWSSSDESIAIVDSDGVVTALMEGKVTITAKAKDDSGKSDSVRVTVREETPATSVTIINQNLTMVPGETTTLQKAINPTASTDRFTWESDNITVATVDRSTGKVTARSPGNANITVMTESGKTATTKVTVVGLNATSLELEQYSTYTLSVIGVTQGVTWDVADSSVAVVTDGVVSTRRIGTTTITATVNGRKLTCKLKVVAIR